MKLLLILAFLIAFASASLLAHAQLSLKQADDWSKPTITDLMPQQPKTITQQNATHETKEHRIASCMARGLPEGC